MQTPARLVITARLGPLCTKPELRGEQRKQKHPSAGTGVCSGPAPSGVDVGNWDLESPWPPSPAFLAPCALSHVMSRGVQQGKLTAEGVWASDLCFTSTFLSLACPKMQPVAPRGPGMQRDARCCRAPAPLWHHWVAAGLQRGHKTSLLIAGDLKVPAGPHVPISATSLCFPAGILHPCSPPVASGSGCSLGSLWGSGAALLPVGPWQMMPHLRKPSLGSATAPPP